MRIVVLGGSGTQGRAAVLDLARSEAVDEVVNADSAPSVDSLRGVDDLSRVRDGTLDAAGRSSLIDLLGSADVAIDQMPRQFLSEVGSAAVEEGVSVVNTNYASDVAHFDTPAREAGIAIMPECGLDPGIDLVKYGQAARRF